MTEPNSANKILIVDDNETNRYVLRKVLATRGVEVMEAGSAEQALAAVRSVPDLVLMDIHLPDSTGYALLEKLRAQPETVDVPVILMSAVEPPPHARNAAAALGVRSFLTLPVVPDDLWIVIEATMHRRKRQG